MTGRAPCSLTWEIGCSPAAAPLWTYRGERLVRRFGQERIVPAARANSPARPVSPPAGLAHAGRAM